MPGNPIGFGPPGQGIFHPRSVAARDILRPADCYRNAILTDLPLGYWRLGEPSGTNAVDVAAGDNGTYLNTPTLGVAGLLPGDADTAVTFAAASSQSVQASAAAYALANGPFSFSVVFKTSAAGANFWLVSFEHIAGAAGTIGLALGPSANGKLSVMDGSNRIISSAAATYNDNVAHFAVVTKSVLNEWHLYVDGLDVGVDDSTPHVATTTAASVETNIGARRNGAPLAQFFTGTLDEVAVFGTELSLAQVRFHYDARLVACAAAAFDPATMDWGLDAQADAWINPTWFAPEASVEGLVPPAAGVFDPTATAAAMQQAEPSESIDRTQTWLGAIVDLVGVRESPPAATAAEQAAVQPDVSGQQDRSLDVRWFQPDTEVLGDIPRVSAPFDPAPSVGALQGGDPSEARRNDPTWFQPADADGPLRASKYTNDRGVTQIDPRSSYGVVVLVDAPISYWRLDEPFDSQAGQLSAGWYTPYDVALYIGAHAEWRTGQWVGSPVNVTPGLLTGDPDGAAVFDGSSYVYVPANEAYQPSTSDFSAEAWFQTSVAATQILVGSGGYGVVPGWQVAMSAAGVVQFNVTDGVVGGLQINSPAGFNDGRRHTVVGTRTGVTMTLSVDGALVATGTDSVTRDATTTDPFVIGGRSDIVGFFTGTLDEVAVYPVALDASQIGTHYLVGTQGWAPLIQTGDLSEQRANTATWFTPDLPAETPFPPSAPAVFDPASGFDWGRDNQQDRSVQPVWFVPDLPAEGLTTGQVTTATVAQQAALWPDQSAQQDRGIQPVWAHPPDDTLAIFPYIPIAPPITTDQMAACWAEQPGQERGNGQVWYNAALEPVDGPLQSWLFTTGSPGTGGAPPVLIDAETGDVYFSIGGNLIVPATNA